MTRLNLNWVIESRYANAYWVDGLIEPLKVFWSRRLADGRLQVQGALSCSSLVLNGSSTISGYLILLGQWDELV